MSEPKPADPNVDPNATPPEGDKTPAGEVKDINYWTKKFGDSENEKGNLRKNLETEKANSEFWQQKAQENVQAPPPPPQNGDVNLDPMDENFGKNLVSVIGDTVVGAMQTQNNRNLVERHTQELMDKYNLSHQKAQGILNYGYNNGANNSEQAKQIFTRDLAGMGSEFLGGDPPPVIPDPNPNPNPNPPPNQINYKVEPPPVPTGGETGSGSQMAKVSIDEWNAMTDDQKRAHKAKVQSGQVEFDATNATFTPIA